MIYQISDSSGSVQLLRYHVHVFAHWLGYLANIIFDSVCGLIRALERISDTSLVLEQAAFVFAQAELVALASC